MHGIDDVVARKDVVGGAIHNHGRRPEGFAGGEIAGEDGTIDRLAALFDLFANGGDIGRGRRGLRVLGGVGGTDEGTRGKFSPGPLRKARLRPRF